MANVDYENEWRKEKALREKYENILHSIANIDCAFMNSEGDFDTYTDKQALEEIEKLVEPIWNEYCEKNRS